jgi:hypothetical protein
MTNVERQAKCILDEMLRDVGDIEIFLDKNECRIMKGDKVKFLGNLHQTKGIGELGVIEHLRFGYSKKFGFSSNQLPLVLVKLDNGDWGGEIHTSCVEKV